MSVTVDGSAGYNGTGPAIRSDDPAVIRADIDATRAALGDTVEQLAARTDVKARMKEARAHGMANAREAGRRWWPVGAAAAAAIIISAIGIVVAKRRNWS
jgi:hypothetical protein